MGITRKDAGTSTDGVAHHRSAHPKTARCAKKSNQLEKRAPQGKGPSVSLFWWLLERTKKG